MIPTSFENEQELQNVLAENPQLLVADGSPPPVLLSQQLTLPEAGTLDLLLLDVDSIPVVVGTALGPCGDCRRDVVAEAIDYISALAQLTVAQLDHAARGAVERALRTLAGGDGHDFERRRASLAANLRSARVKFIVVAEELGPSLARMIKLLSEHSRLDIQCVAVGSGRVSRPIDRTPSPNGIRLVGAATSYRKATAPAWRASAPYQVSAQYQFVKRAGVWTEAYREDAFADGSAPRVAETPPGDLGRVHWDG
jgi:hypothetical protein